MKLKEAFLWQPGWFHQGVILIAGAMLVTAISYLHNATGLAYEFHGLFIVPVLDAMKRNGWPVTFSIGVASYNVTPEDVDRLLKQADALMYEVKHGGRNRILLREF